MNGQPLSTVKVSVSLPGADALGLLDGSRLVLVSGTIGPEMAPFLKQRIKLVVRPYGNAVVFGDEVSYLLVILLNSKESATTFK